jgi:hypothetical protein
MVLDGFGALIGIDESVRDLPRQVMHAVREGDRQLEIASANVRGVVCAGCAQFVDGGCRNVCIDLVGLSIHANGKQVSLEQG